MPDAVRARWRFRAVHPFRARQRRHGVGTTAQDGLASTIALARTADRWGFLRFWMSEHHVMGETSVSSPLLMVARLIARRHGSGSARAA
ncbi:LLM class flavin-dependent oxidoreductase [Rhodococcus erythropolis]|uniref:LLM class flavin-dependent oxidoreductase n=1 Tax=Rhodococcus erythropolis TaxID=1833 RepID=UPI001C40707E|nr:LLM class flavin-dependent oxidoreductase [Rhodococcus erythropolis]